MRISCQFDAGAIDVVQADSARDIQLNIRRDSHAEFRQWFYFRVTGVQGQALKIRLLNASECTYHYGWEGYQAVVSYDRQNWFRAPTRYDGSELVIDWTPEQDNVWVAYFEPYPESRHHEFIGRIAQDPRVSVEALGLSLDGREIELVRIGQPDPRKRKIWVVARQHPGETMGEWCAEGLIERLLDRGDAVSLRLLDQAVFYLVPNINPDGSARGNLRTNASGANLNREWLNPSLEKSPEVFYVRAKMHQIGVDAFIDLHGDETIAQVFIDGNAMLPEWTPERDRLEKAFLQDLLDVTPDFQTQEGYALDRFNDEMLTLASKYIGHTFGCLALTLEMPFKDHNDNPHPLTGWSGARSKKLGADLLVVLLRHLQRTVHAHAA